MATHIAFLRAINVGGHTVKMDRLRALFEELGLADVRTYIQSGNVFFEASRPNRAALTARIESHLRDALGYDVPTFVRSVADMERALARNSFAKVKVDEQTRLHVVLISAPLPGATKLPLTKDNIELLDATKGEAFVIVQRQQPGKAVNASAFVEKQFPGLRATARFHATMEKIVAAAKGDG